MENAQAMIKKKKKKIKEQHFKYVHANPF